MDLFSPVTDLRGVGPARAAALQRLGIFTLYDLLAYFPRDYEDRTNPVEIAQLQPGVPACFEALVVSQPVLRRIGKGRDVTNLTVADETGKLTLHYFNQPYIKTQLHYGERYYFYGALLERGMQMANPAFEEAGRPGTVTNRLLPVYPLTAGLSNRTLCACIRQAFSAAGALPELLPETVREQYGLCGVTEAYTAVHAPESWEALQSARKRLVTFAKRLAEQLLPPGSEHIRLTEPQLAEVRRLADETYHAWDWTWGKTPAFTYEKSAEFAGKPIFVRYEARRGLLRNAEVRSDALDAQALCAMLNGVRLDPALFLELCRTLAGERAEELLDCLM